MNAFFQTLADELGKRAALYLTVLIGSGAVGGTYLWDPFYHAGWIISYNGWIFLFVVLGATSILVSYSTFGLIAVMALALIVGFAFGHLYKNPDYLHGEWPFWTWFLHLVLFCLLAGVLVGFGNWLVGKRMPKPPTRRRTARKAKASVAEAPRPSSTGQVGADNNAPNDRPQ